MQNPFIYYGICYYAGRDKRSNIKKHYNIFKSLEYTNKKFFVVFNIDSFDKKRRNNIAKHIINKLNIKVDYLTDYNWGGTIGALYNLFKHLKKNKNQNDIIAFFEEDFYPIDENWLFDALKYLKDFDYIGEGTKESNNPELCEVKNSNNCKDRTGKIKKKMKDFEVWTDGGFYFSNLYKLNAFEKKIGIFHKGNMKKKYERQLDGIDIGEVGFPTLLYHNNFKFAGLFRKKYFIHEE